MTSSQVTQKKEPRYISTHILRILTLPAEGRGLHNTDSVHRVTQYRPCSCQEEDLDES